MSFGVWALAVSGWLALTLYVFSRSRAGLDESALRVTPSRTVVDPPRSSGSAPSLVDRIAPYGDGVSTWERLPMDEQEEPDEVFWWRFDYALRLGFPADEALQCAANHDLDLHVVERMRERGCPLALALEIAA